MNPEQVKHVQDSFAKVQPVASQTADMFYGRLFETAPEVRALFPGDISDHKAKLLAMVGMVVTNLQHLHMLIPPMQAMSRQHGGCGVMDGYYQLVGDALIWSLEKVLGQEFTDDVKEAWLTAYTTLATVMKDAANAPPAPAWPRPSPQLGMAL